MDHHRQPWTILALLAVAQFMVILDITVVNVALPSIGRELGFGDADLQWVVTAYVLATGGLLLLGGRMADLLERRRVFVAGLALFTAASVASGLAPTPAALIAARALQGVGAAMLSPAALAILTTTYGGPQRTTALSVWGALGAAGAAAGVLLGGLLTSLLSWEWIFFVNGPIGALAIVLALRLVPAGAARSGALRELDLPGTAAVVGGLVLLVYAIEGTATHGWGSARTLAGLALAALLLLAFAAIERRASHPLVPPATWRERTLVSSAIVILGATATLVGTFFLSSLLLQRALDASALETGLAFLPLVVVIGIAARATPRLLGRVGARNVIAGGMALVAGGQLLLSGASADAGYLADLLPGFLLVGAGVGVVFVAASVTAMSQVAPERAGLASGLMTNAHELGGAFGVSILSAIAVAGDYGDGALASAGIALALALAALVVVPAFRPVAGGTGAVH